MDTTKSTLTIAVEYLCANRASIDNPGGGTAHGYRYFDATSDQYWLSATADLEALGEQLLEFRAGEETGAIVNDVGEGEARIYDTWCQRTKSLEA